MESFPQGVVSEVFSKYSLKFNEKFPTSNCNFPALCVGL